MGQPDEITAQRRMPLPAALSALHEVRTDQLILTTMGPAREWAKLPANPLDFCHIPACMGHTSAIGLGLALAQPRRQVIVLNADGSMLMSLGNLVTIAAARPQNLTLIVCDNAMYEVTGRQRTPCGTVDFAGLASAAGFPSVARFDDLAAWKAGICDALAQPGPRFIHLLVEPVWGEDSLQVPVIDPISRQIARFRERIGGG